MGSNRKLESKVALTVSIFDHNVNTFNSFNCLEIFISADFKWTNQGLVSLIALSIYYISVQAFFFCNSLVMPLFDFADLIWGDKHNVTLMPSLDRPLYSSATYALATLKWVPLEKKAFSEKMYLCV